jgi:hypothetical protein
MRQASSHGKDQKENGGGIWERFLIHLGKHQRYFTVEEIAKELDVSQELVNALIEELLVHHRRMNEVNGRPTDYERKLTPKTDYKWKLTPKGRRQLLDRLRKERSSKDVSEALSRAKSDSEIDRIRVDYEQTLATYRMLADIRFKLLAFVPTISGAAITLLSSKIAQTQPQTTLVISMLGFLVTLGIAFYDQRNSEIHDQMVSRAGFLERVLQFPVFDRREGHMRQRPKHSRYLFNIYEIWHDRALALIYGTVLGAWLFPFCYALFSVVGGARQLAAWASVVFAGLAAIAFIAEFHRSRNCAHRRTAEGFSPLFCCFTAFVITIELADKSLMYNVP